MLNLVHMRILHARCESARRSFRSLEQWRRFSRGRQVLAAIPLRAGGSVSDVSLLFPDDRSASWMAESLVSQTSGIAWRVKQYSVPPDEVIEAPIVIVGAPRSGTTLLFEILRRCPGVWTIGGESHDVIEPGRCVPGPQGNRLQCGDAGPDRRTAMLGAFLSVMRNGDGQFYVELEPADRPTRVRFLEKTPKNSLRIPFLHAIFPQARFVFLYREPWANIGSLIDGWSAPDRFNSYKINGKYWKFLLPPDWQNLIDRPTSEIAAAQWRVANESILEDLAQIPSAEWCFVDYDGLIANPITEIGRICKFCSLELDAATLALLCGKLPLSRSTLTPPKSEKWRPHQTAIAGLMPSLEVVLRGVEMAKKLGGLD